MLSDPHIGFVIAAYSVTFVVLVGMIGSVVLDTRRLSAHLDKANRALDAARRAKDRSR